MEEEKAKGRDVRSGEGKGREKKKKKEYNWRRRVRRAPWREAGESAGEVGRTG